MQFFDLGWIKRMFFTEPEEPEEPEESRDELLERLEREYDKKEDSTD